MVVDATAVPPDRGGVGRYVDELLPALVAEGADLAVVVQAHDVGYYRALLPGVDLLDAPTAIARPAARFAWEQVGLPALVRREGLDIAYVDVIDRPRHSGVSNYGFFDRLWIGIMDLAGVWWLIRRKKPTPAVTEVF